MRWLARFLLTLSLAVWLGSVVFFSFVVAPTAFFVLPSPDLAAAVVGRSLGALHFMGLICGAIFLAATIFVALRRDRSLRILVGAMLVCTAFSQFRINPQMQHIREAVGGAIQALPAQDAGRAAFGRLHQFSVALEGVVLLAGVVAAGILAAERNDLP